MKKTLRYLGKGLGILLLLVVLYLLAAVVGSLIPVNKDTDTANGEVEIFFRTNGVHTSLILPVRNRTTNWKEVVDFQHTLSKREDFEYVSFGWGDLEFYKNTPEWSDLTLPVAFKALFMESPSALNVEFYRQVSEDEDTFSIVITNQQYQALTQYIKSSFEYGQKGNAQPIPNLHYNHKDVFYRARRHLNLFYTCNTWSNNALKKSGLRACLWTPFDKSIFYQYDRSSFPFL